MISQVFQPVEGTGADRHHPAQRFGFAAGYSSFNAFERFKLEPLAVAESPLCIAGQVLRGNAKPTDCPAFARECTPQTPLGAPMVSAEGACAAYYRYHKAVA